MEGRSRSRGTGQLNLVPRAFCHIVKRLKENFPFRLRPNMTKGPGDKVAGSWEEQTKRHLKESLRPGGVLDQILDGDVPSRFQKHTRSLYQFFKNVYPTLYQFFKNMYPNLYQFSEKAYLTLYQLQKFQKSTPFLIPKS